jgi:DNA phosphorothioation-associated putative methyltransferase
VEGGRPQGLDWEIIRVQFGIGQPPKRQWELLYEKNQWLLDEFWSVTLELGRLPESTEFSRIGELREQIGTPKQALRVLVQKGGAGEIKKAAETRKRDLLVYVALANLQKRVPFGHLSPNLQTDIRSFFGNYSRALEKGLELLYAAGDPGEIEIACEGLNLGWQDEQALYVHRSLLGELHPVLRAYVGCATALFGDVSQADVIKLHKATRKVTFLVYDDFDGNPLPVLRQRIKVNLRTRWVEVFDHSNDEQLLFYKERLLSVADPRQTQLQAYSAKIRKLGVPDIFGTRPYREELAQILDEAGLNWNLSRRRQARSASTTG